MNPFSSRNLTATVGAVALVVILGGVYWFFFAGVSAPPSPLTEVTASGADNPVFALTSQLSSVSFDVSIFSDPRFASLRDISTPITPEPIGKNDPFAPL